MRKALLALAAILAVLLPGTPAWAHVQLVSADPAKDAMLATAPTAVTLTFSERLNPGFATIVISDAARQRVPASAFAIEARAGSMTLTQSLDNGPYTVAYRVVSVDGHTLQGSYTFTVNDPAKPAAVPPPASAAAATPAAASAGIPTEVLMGLAAGGVLLAAVAAYLYLVARRRTAVQPR